MLLILSLEPFYISRAVPESREALYTTQLLKAHCELDLIISCLHPFSIVENEVYRRNVKYLHVDRKSSTKYIISLTKLVGSWIRDILPGKLVLEFDDGTERSTQNVAI